MPKILKNVIAKYQYESWSVLHTFNTSGHFVDIYKANGKPIFQLTYWNVLSKPSLTIF